MCRCPWRTDQVTNIRAKSTINIQLRSLQINTRSTRADGIAVSSVVPAVCGGFKQTDYSRSALQQVVHSTAPTGHCRIQRNRRYQVLVEQWSQARTTLFPKYFTSFPHGTCSLSDSRKYLAVEIIYYLVHIPVPGNATPRVRAPHNASQVLNWTVTIH